ncbi:hypothetical protein [Tepidibacter thalassicus]|uniref:Uncharacterized protein n=1 Tax=Tepidibacter thalassicus DSM 15285 TaxID=1123350 RepID=A0A1M5NWQ3_9FIRM|nr:hypothetical protein [Tepidibacter thalassicus]SHG93413.1 hypothetical protein SAMN02744040_00237 [Tepidibacter thalassicus DSM 15285]
MDYKNLLGLELEEVENILKRKNITYVIREIRGHKDKETLKIPRVIMVKEKDNIIELVITYFSDFLK